MANSAINRRMWVLPAPLNGSVDRTDRYMLGIVHSFGAQFSESVVFAISNDFISFETGVDVLEVIAFDLRNSIYEQLNVGVGQSVSFVANLAMTETSTLNVSEAISFDGFLSIINKTYARGDLRARTSFILDKKSSSYVIDKKVNSFESIGSQTEFVCSENESSFISSNKQSSFISSAKKCRFLSEEDT